MRPGVQPLARDHGFGRIGATAHEVGASNGRLERADRPRPRVELGELVGVPRGARRDADLVQLEQVRERIEVRATLDAGPQDRQGAGVVSRKRSGRDRGGRAGSDRGHDGPVHHAQRHPGLLIEQRDQGLMGRQASLVVPREDRDQFGFERRAGEVAGHRAEEAVRRSRDDAWWDRGPPRAQVSERGLERAEQRRQVDEAADVVRVQQQQGRHRPMIGVTRCRRPRSCVVRAGRLRRPARPLVRPSSAQAPPGSSVTSMGS